MSEVRNKDVLGIDFTMTPTEGIQRWNVAGMVDPDTLYNLHMRLQRRRWGEWAPIVGKEGLQYIAQFGEIKPQDRKERLFHIYLTVPPNNIYRFISRTWRPFAHQFEYDAIKPIYHLGDNERDYRILPQKNEDNNVYHYSHLVVKQTGNIGS